MNQLLPQEVVDQIMREEQHFAAAPQAFFEVWKRGVEIAGPQWFGDGTREGLNQAKSKWDLRPDMLRANDASSSSMPTHPRYWACHWPRPSRHATRKPSPLSPICQPASHQEPGWFNSIGAISCSPISSCPRPTSRISLEPASTP